VILELLLSILWLPVVELVEVEQVVEVVLEDIELALDLQ
jgi:hypothetical protein